MTSPKYAASEETGRYYRFPDTPPLISVTSVIGVFSKPALVPWASKLAGERAVHHELEWHAIGDEYRESQWQKFAKKKCNEDRDPTEAQLRKWSMDGDEAARKWISAASKEYMTQRQVLGSAVHYACETDFDMSDPRMVAFVEQVGDEKAIRNMYQQYRQFLSDNDVKIVAQEMTVASLTHGYAGTLDLIIETNGRRLLADIKTGTGVYATTALQLAAYRYAEYQASDEGSLYSYDPQVDGAIVIHLKPMSHKIVEFRCDEEVFEVFLKAKDLKTWDDSSKEMFV